MTTQGFARRLAAVALTFSWFLLPAASHAAATCATSVASLKGWYGIIIAGQSTAATPVAQFSSGAALFDGAGNLSGSNFYGAAGARNGITGTYSVNADCSVTINTVVASVSSTYTVALKLTGEAVGIETDANGVSTISLKPQYATYTPGLNFNTSSLNGSFAASCGGFLGAYSDVNLVTFNNGQLSGTDPYNNSGSFVAANNPYTGTYTVNSDGTFAGTLVVGGTSFGYYGVISTVNSVVDYFYTNVANGVPTNAIAACSGATAVGGAAVTPVTPAAQSITFNPIPAQKAGTTLALSATATSGLAVTFTSTTPATCTVSGNTASFVAVGSCSIVASQGGNASYAAATPVTQPVTVSATVGSFTLSSSASSVSVTPPVCFFSFCFGGSSGTDVISVTGQNGFAGTVAFSVTGLPSGVSAAFSPTTVSNAGSTRLTLTPASGTASAKSTTITITGVSGAVSSSVKVTLSY